MKRLVVIGAIVAIFVGCGGSSSIDKAVGQIEKAIEKVEKNKGKMTENDWHNLEKEVEEPLKILADALEKDKVGAIQKLKLMTLTAKWATVVIAAGVTEIEKSTGINRENWETELEKAAQELEKAAQEIEKAAQGVEKREE